MSLGLPLRGHIVLQSPVDEKKKRSKDSDKVAYCVFTCLPLVARDCRTSSDKQLWLYLLARLALSLV